MSDTTRGPGATDRFTGRAPGPAAVALTRLADAITARDWPSLRAVLADDCLVRELHTGEELDADAFVDLNRTYPGDWVHTTQEVVDGGARAVLRSRTVIDGETWHAASFGSTDDTGRLVELVEVWTDAVAPHPTRSPS